MTNEWVVASLFAALEGKIPKVYVGQIADHLPTGLFGLYPRLELAKLTTMLKEREDTIHHLERKCDLLMARVRELRNLLGTFEATPGGKTEDWGTSDDRHLKLLEVVLRLNGDFRRTLEPIHVTPLQAGLLHYLQRCPDARMLEAAAHLRVRPPTLTEVIGDLIRKRWVIKRQSAEDGRVYRLRLSRRGEAITKTIEHHVRQMEATLSDPAAH